MSAAPTARAALTALRRWLIAVYLTCSVACGVYDPSLVESHQQGQSSAGAGAGALDAGAAHNGDAGGRCELAQTRCELPHAQAICVSGRCLIVSCNPPYADCDDEPANGCEADLTSAEHCGLCHTQCRFGHATGRCEAGRCSLAACETGYDDCDANANNGCEQKVDSLNDCGACGVRCDKPPHASAGCHDDACGVGSCDTGYGDCNMDAADGCEQRLNGLHHCGSCGMSCELPHTQDGQCQDGRCVVKDCAPGFADCNGSPNDGCEADLASPGSCGSCGAACDLLHTTQARCVQAQGQPQCQVDHGCSADGELASSECMERETTGCSAGYADCDAKAENGCETDLSRLSSCGDCHVSCVLPHATSACRSGHCVTLRCDPGYGACDDGGQCQSLLDDPKNCGACGQVCKDSERCVGGRCTASRCDAQHADCDGDAGNGCETALTSLSDCGGCGVACAAVAHAQLQCQDGSCAVARCDEGFADCDGDPRNGCEADLDSTDDCGACGHVCAFPHAQARCHAGLCERTDCDDHHADCNGADGDGCESDLRLPDSCGGCGQRCRALPNVAGSTCGPDGCMIQCQSARGDCDGVADNGCEADLTLAISCGSCHTDCTKLPQVSSARCSEGTCSGLTCSDGYADCNGLAADGCERALNTLTDCGACDKPCAVAHAQADCRSGQCRAGQCDDGFGDCDGDASNGCETILNAASHCGACGTACASGTTCVNGACSCLNDAQCASGSSCCDGRCVNTSGSCFPFPCIPGTQLPANTLNCGACGSLCLGWCCGELL